MATKWMPVCVRPVKSITISDTVSPCDLCTVFAEAGRKGNYVLATSLFLPTVNFRISGTIGALYFFLLKACVLLPISSSSNCTQMTPLAFLSGGTWTHFTLQLAPFFKPSAVLTFSTIAYFKPNAMCNSCCNCIVFLASVVIRINNALRTSADTDSTMQSMALISYFSVCAFRYVCRLWESTRSFWRYRCRLLLNRSCSSESNLVNLVASKLLSDSVRFPSRIRFSSCANCPPLSCLITVVSSNIFAFCCHRLVASGAYPVLLCLNINESQTGFNWNKSPTNITEIPPKSRELPIISCKRLCTNSVTWLCVFWREITSVLSWHRA